MEERQQDVDQLGDQGSIDMPSKSTSCRCVCVRAYTSMQVFMSTYFDM